MGLEETELVMQIEDLPSFNFTNLSEVLNSTTKLNEKYVAKEFILALDATVKHEKLDELGFLYDYAFNKLSNEYFANKCWPEVAILEREDETLEVDLDTQNLYNELAYRHVYAR